MKEKPRALSVVLKKYKSAESEMQAANKICRQLRTQGRELLMEEDSYMRELHHDGKSVDSLLPKAAGDSRVRPAIRKECEELSGQLAEASKTAAARGKEFDLVKADLETQMKAAISEHKSRLSAKLIRLENEAAAAILPYCENLEEAILTAKHCSKLMEIAKTISPLEHLRTLEARAGVIIGWAEQP